MIKRVAIYVLFSLISGCASGPKTSSPTLSTDQSSPQWHQHAEKVEQLSQWQAQGRIAASKAGQGGNASFVWDHEPNFYKIRMFGPFGAGSAELTGSDKQVVFDQADGSRTLAKTPEQILYQRTGLYIPVQGLSFWIKGLPSPHLPVDKLGIDGQGRMAYLVQSGWHIQFQSYEQVGLQALPNRLNLTREDMKVKLIVKNWTVK